MIAIVSLFSCASDNDYVNVLLLSHSVMPWVDTVDKIKEYANEKNAIDNKLAFGYK